MTVCEGMEDSFRGCRLAPHLIICRPWTADCSRVSTEFMGVARDLWAVSREPFDWVLNRPPTLATDIYIGYITGVGGKLLSKSNSITNY